MNAAELNERFRVIPDQGPFAGLKTGSRAERPDFSEWDVYDRLPPVGRHVAQEVWSGVREEVDLIDGDTIYRLRHVGCGLPDPNGRLYGFAVKTLRLAPASPVGSSANGVRRPRGFAFVGVLLLTLTAFSGGWSLAYFAPHLSPTWLSLPERAEVPPAPQPKPRPQPLPQVAAPAPPQSATASEALSLTPADTARRKAALSEFNRITDEMDELNKKDAAYLNARKQAAGAYSTPSKP